MRETVSPAPPVVHNPFEAVREMFGQYVVPSYGRFDVALTHGAGSYVWDVNGKRYLDLGAGIAVCCLGHANPEITQALTDQSRRLVHVSNLYYHELQGRLARRLVELIGPGKVFFCNSGAEANEGLFKLARKFGHHEGRFEILTAVNSFHGRTLAGIAATGQEKVKKGFEPMVAGFRHVPFGDLSAMREALSPATVAILIEGIQGEGGVTPASAEYLLGLRALCDERKLLFLMDGVQDGHFRTGRFQSFQRLLENAGPAGSLPPSVHGDSAESLAPSSPSTAASGAPRSSERPFLPDGLSMAKSLGGGFPIGAFWVREQAHGVRLADLLGPGTHASTFGGTPLACGVALRILDVIERDRLAENARALGEFLKSELSRLANQSPAVIREVRGVGLMIGFELAPDIPAFANGGQTASVQFVQRLHEAGVLTVPSGAQVVRLLPPLNLTRQQAAEGLAAVERVVGTVA